jgi:hypothetical protein
MHSHGHGDVNSILINFKEFWSIAHLRDTFKINSRNEWEPAIYQNYVGTSMPKCLRMGAVFMKQKSSKKH